MLVAWKLLKDSEFPLIVLDLPEAVMFPSLWSRKDAEQVQEGKVF